MHAEQVAQQCIQKFCDILRIHIAAGRHLVTIVIKLEVGKEKVVT